MKRKTPPTRLSGDAYRALCHALETHREWSATRDEIEAVRKAIQNRECLQLLTREEIDLAKIVLGSYATRILPSRQPRMTKPVYPSKPGDRDLSHLEPIVERLAADQQTRRE
jgi:hypothetical protein